MEIPFIQYVLPHGRRKEIAVDRPAEIATPALALIEKGYRFECEMLTDMETVSLTVVGPDDDGDVAIEISKNGPEIIGAVDRLVAKAAAFDATPPLAALWSTLTDRPLSSLYVMQQDERGGTPAGLASTYWFVEEGPGGVERMKVGCALGGNEACEERWPVYLNRKRVAELRDDASGYALHVARPGANKLSEPPQEHQQQDDDDHQPEQAAAERRAAVVAGVPAPAASAEEEQDQ